MSTVKDKVKKNVRYFYSVPFSWLVLNISSQQSPDKKFQNQMVNKILLRHKLMCDQPPCANYVSIKESHLKNHTEVVKKLFQNQW